MSRFVFSLPLFFALRLAMAGNSIEFSASDHSFNGEGVVYHRLIFKDEAREIFYQPPTGWTCHLIENGLRIVPPEKTMAEGKLESFAIDKPVALDAKGFENFQQRVIATLPADSQGVAVIKQEQNGFFVNNIAVAEVVVSYNAFGETFERGVVLLNASANQTRFQFTARKREFDALYRAFRTSIMSWEWQPGELASTDHVAPAAAQ
ncbi:MAG: hypothetical protein ACJ8M1_01045 [Chthoniobacterales bacterium]